MGSPDLSRTLLPTQSLDSTTMPRYGRRKKTYGKTKRGKRAYTAKRKRSTKRGFKSRNHVSRQTSRYPAIQRGTFTPQTKMIEFVEDRTFYLEPNGDIVDNPPAPFLKRTTCGLNMVLTNPFDGVFKLGTNENPFAGPLASTTGQQGGNLQDQPPGWDRWLGFGPESPYREGIVVGAKYEFRVEQLHRTVGAGSGVKTFACMHWIDKKEGGIINIEQITDLQAKRGVRQSNMVGLHDNVSATSQANANAQQCGGSGTYSCKKFWGITDIKDNLYEKGGQYTSPGQFAGPNNNAYLHIAFCDRITGPTPSGYVMPGLLVRVKVKLIMLLTQANSGFNKAVGGAGAMAEGAA